MLCVPMERGPLGPWQFELAADLSVNSQEPSLCSLKVSVTVFVKMETPSSCQLSLSVAFIDDGNCMTFVT